MLIPSWKCCPHKKFEVLEIFVTLRRATWTICFTVKVWGSSPCFREQFDCLHDAASRSHLDLLLHSQRAALAQFLNSDEWRWKRSSFAALWNVLWHKCDQDRILSYGTAAKVQLQFPTVDRWWLVGWCVNMVKLLAWSLIWLKCWKKEEGRDVGSPLSFALANQCWGSVLGMAAE